MRCPECGGELGSLCGPLRRRPDVIWLRCLACDWIGRRRNSADPELRTLHSYEGRDALCSWCGDDNYVYEEADAPAERFGRPGRWVTDFCLDCGRAGSWFREEKGPA
ncbi:hypothetical protein OG535_22720 [Kitasatospora sp. NBC_00085]|uniref:hypothetical protein n=1 Tax=unclassified Kitasatospora TaxID=2633591 RepID=UPI0032461B82